MALASTYGDQFYFGKYLVLGKELALSGLIADRPFSYSPVYCYFIAVCRLVFGESLLPVLILQVLLGGLTCVLLCMIAGHFVGPRWGAGVAIVAALYRSFVLYDVTLLSDAFGLLLQMGLLWGLLNLKERASMRILALLGVIVGLCILQRPHCMLMVPGIGLGLLLRGFSWRLASRAGFAITGVAVLVTLPVVLQNFSLTGTPGITASNPGYILYSSNNSSSYGFRYSPPELYSRGTAYFERGGSGAKFVGDAEIAAMISGAVEGRRMSLSDSSRYYLGFTVAHVSRYPVHYLKLFFQRAQLAFHAYEAHDVLPVFARYRKVETWAPFEFGWVAPIGLLGLALSVLRWRQYIWLYVLLCNQLALLLGFYVVVRFRLPVEALLLVFAAVACKHIAGWIRTRDVVRLGAAGASLVVLTLGTHWLPEVTANRAHSRDMDVLFEDALRLLSHGQNEEAVVRLRELVDQDQEILRRSESARQMLNQVTRSDAFEARSPQKLRDLLIARREGGAITLQEMRYLGWLTLAQGSAAEAQDVLGAYLVSRPQDSLVRYELGRVQYAQGQHRDARVNIETAVDDGLLFTTRGINGCETLAAIASTTGDSTEARRWVSQGIRLTSLLRWYSHDKTASDAASRLASLDGSTRPADLSDLEPY